RGSSILAKPRTPPTKRTIADNKMLTHTHCSQIFNFIGTGGIVKFVSEVLFTPRYIITKHKVLGALWHKLHGTNKVIHAQLCIVGITHIITSAYMNGAYIVFSQIHWH